MTIINENYLIFLCAIIFTFVMRSRNILFGNRKELLYTIKGMHKLRVSLIFYDYECVKFDSNCPYMTTRIDPNSPCFLTPILTPLDSVQNGLKRSKMVKSYIFKFCEVPKTLDFQHFSHMDQTGVDTTVKSL